MKRIVFFGTPRFAATILEALLSHGANIVGVVTKPDKPVGRSSELMPPPVKILANKKGILLFQPLKASTPEFAEELKKLSPDLFVVVAYSEIFKEILLQLPPQGCINVHASLLPKYRGAAPIHRAVMAGETETGVTIMSMAKELDAGEILSVAKTPITPETTSQDLFEVLAKLGAEELWKVLEAFERGDVKGQAQDPSLATYAPKVNFSDGKIDWKKPANELHNLVRGLFPKPGAWCEVVVRKEKKRLLIKKSSIADGQGSPGDILSQKGLIIACGQGALNLLEIQLEGKKAMKTEEFLRGISKEELSFI